MSTGNQSSLSELIHQLSQLHAEMLNLEAESRPDISEIHPEHRASATNLLHYLALRRHDIRTLQERLAAMSLSSLGRTESHVLSALSGVIDVLEHLAGQEQTTRDADPAAIGFDDGQNLLTRNTDALLGPAPEGRKVRIMVTMPSEAATDYELVRDLLLNGMNCMRINCAHDGPAQWSGMIANLRRAEQETAKACLVCMDVAGPKLRTGPIQAGPAVLKYRPKRDSYGRVEIPARIWLTPEDKPEPSPTAETISISVPRDWLANLQPGNRVRFTDARGARRFMTVTEVCGESRRAEASRTAYLTPGMTLEVKAAPGLAADNDSFRFAKVGLFPPTPQTLRLKKGDVLVLTRSLEPGEPAKLAEDGQVCRAHVGVTLSEFFDCVRPGEPIWFDDGKIGGIIAATSHDQAEVEITHASASGAKLAAEKGINVPETNLRIPSLTADDLKTLEFIVQHADIVGYSFVRSGSDVAALQAELARLGNSEIGIILKIETQKGFLNLPRILLVAMRSHSLGVMIARGDLAVECGYQRLAEVQEEILWICEAAHLPVIWATQVLESLAKAGIPSRSEITDAAMGERAECVMLNKGPFIVDAVRILDDILRRMQSHQEKKRSMLRRLHVASTFTASQGK